MADGLRVHADDYREFFEKTKGLDKRVRNGVRKRIRESAKRVAPKIVSEGAADLPSSGGLAANVVKKSGGPTIIQNASGVRMVLGRKKGPQIGRMNAGQLRHPVFPRKSTGGTDRALVAILGRKGWTWVEQKVPAGTFTEAFEKHADEVRDAVVKEMHTILKELKV